MLAGLLFELNANMRKTKLCVFVHQMTAVTDGACGPQLFLTAGNVLRSAAATLQTLTHIWLVGENNILLFVKETSS